MATKKYEKICDRCGVEAELLDDRIERGWIKAGFPAKSGFLGCGGIPPRFDLCPDCRSSLII